MPAEEALTTDAIVIGAGHGGLVAAAHLARAGLAVTVIDRQAEAGGLGVSFERSGHRFDVGLHSVGDCGPGGLIPTILRGLDSAGVEFTPLAPDWTQTFHFPDFTFRAPRGEGPWRDALVALFPSERKAIDRYVSFLRYAWRAAGASLSGTTISGEAAWRAYGTTTLSQLLDGLTQEPRLRAVLGAAHGLYALPPSQVSALMHGAVAMHYLRGAWYPRGGGGAIAENLRATIERQGGRFLLRTDVERILVEGGRAAGVAFVGPSGVPVELRARIVISNADYRDTLARLVTPGAVPSTTVQAAQRARMAWPLFLVFAGIRREALEGFKDPECWILPTLDLEEPYREIEQGQLPSRPWVYLTSSTLKDPLTASAPEGRASLELMAVVPPGPRPWGLPHASWDALRGGDEEPYRAAKDRYAAGLLLAARAKYPCLAEAEVLGSSTPRTFWNATRATDGGVYGLALSPEQSGPRRPGVTTELAGLYLAGASLRFGHGIAGAMLSGVAAAAAVLGCAPERLLRGER